MTSPSLAAKIRKTRENAPLELPKARLCSAVIQALVNGKDTDEPVQAMKAVLGRNWSLSLAIQFMSGRRGEMAAQAGTNAERFNLILAHLIAKDICEERTLGAISPSDMAKLKAMADELAARTDGALSC